MAATSGIKMLTTPYHAPRANAMCERFLRMVPLYAEVTEEIKLPIFSADASSSQHSILAHSWEGF